MKIYKVEFLDSDKKQVVDEDNWLTLSHLNGGIKTITYIGNITLVDDNEENKELISDFIKDNISELIKENTLDIIEKYKYIPYPVYISPIVTPTYPNEIYRYEVTCWKE